MSDFPNDLLNQYKATTNKLRKIQRVVFKRFAPNVSDVSEEFQRLGAQFQNGAMPEYAGLCYLGASKCERALNNTVCENHLLTKSARAFIESDMDKLCLRSNAKQHIQGALNCYNMAMSQLDDSCVMKAAIIREVKKIHPNCELTSNFASPAHRAYELDVAANECIRNEDFELALEKITEICDNIAERKVEYLYEEILRQHEITMILLILLLDLPPAKQSPSNVKLYEHFSFRKDCSGELSTRRHSTLVMNSLHSLICACKLRQYATIVESEIPSVAGIAGLTVWQQVLLQKLKDKYAQLR